MFNLDQCNQKGSVIQIKVPLVYYNPLWVAILSSILPVQSAVTGRAADTFNTPHCGVIIVTIMRLNLATKIHFHYTYHVLAILANIMKRSECNIYIKMKVWTMGLFLPAGVDCSEGAIIHQLLVSQPSVQYIADPQNGCVAHSSLTVYIFQSNSF